MNEPRRQKRARVHRTSYQRLLHPTRWTKVEREERKTLGKQYKGIPRPPPPLIPPFRREGGRRRSPGMRDFQRSPRMRKGHWCRGRKSLKGENGVLRKLKHIFPNIYLQNKKHMLTCQRWDWLL